MLVEQLDRGGVPEANKGKCSYLGQLSRVEALDSMFNLQGSLQKYLETTLRSTRLCRLHFSLKALQAPFRFGSLNKQARIIINEDMFEEPIIEEPIISNHKAPTSTSSHLMRLPHALDLCSFDGGFLPNLLFDEAKRPLFVFADPEYKLYIWSSGYGYGLTLTCRLRAGFETKQAEDWLVQR